MTAIPPMHYAVTMALQDAIAALDAGEPLSVTSGVVASLKTRRAVLTEALSHPHRDGGYLKERAELACIARLLDAMAGAGA